ncbi:DNA polymerase III subunit delta' [Ramlibacter sp.]|uniref:DNA polymerase III subunit delta' n=1 Tax=Ramlibacter sp. TaxID=1917967 RepID=UPI002FCC05F8
MTAPWIRAQLRGLLAQRGHAWLLHGPSGLGQYQMGLALVQAWLCDRPTADGACGACESCHQVEVRAHTDLTVLMPETAMQELGWPLGEKAQADIDDKKRKPSREIRVDAMRDMLEFAQRTSGRGRGKAVLVYPAERMNHVTANTLLKTLEEPPGDMRFVLATEAAHQLLPTIRSRCLAHPMAWPRAEEATAWLAEEGVPGAAATVLLRAAGGRPEDALRLHQTGLDARTWSQWPKALVRGDTAGFGQWGPAQLLESLQKLCHDLLAVHSGAAPRFFEAGDLPAAGSVPALTAWWRSLSEAAKTVEHPFNPGLQLESLVAQARTALNSRQP